MCGRYLIMPDSETTGDRKQQQLVAAVIRLTMDGDATQAHIQLADLIIETVVPHHLTAIVVVIGE